MNSTLIDELHQSYGVKRAAIRARLDEFSAVVREGDDARLFEDNGLQTTFASDQCVTHAFHALASADSLQLSVTSEGSWTLPYSSIRVVLPTAEKRALQLPANSLLRLS